MSYSASVVSNIADLLGSAKPSGSGAASFDQVAHFSSLMRSDQPNVGGLENSLGKVVDKVQTELSEKDISIVRSIKDFQSTGSAVALMEASNRGAVRSVMVQLCGTVGKKTADNTEQLYKQQ